MDNIVLQEDSMMWRISYILAFALAQLLTGLHVLAMLLTRRKKRELSAGQRSQLLEDSRAFLYLFLFGRLATVIPSVVLLLLALRYFKQDLDVCVIHFWLYSILSGERLFWARMWTDTGAKCKIAAIITHDKAVLGLLVGSVLLARLSPIGAKVLVLLTISSCRMWSAWECHALWRQCRAKTASSARNFLVGMLVIHLLHLLTVWFTLGVNHYGWFSLVAYFSCVPVGGTLHIRQIWTLYLREKFSGRRDEPLEDDASLMTLERTMDVPPAVHGRPASGWDSD